MAIPLPHKTKRAIKDRVKTLRIEYARWRHPFDRRALALALRRRGLRAGDLVLVHSSYDRFEGFRGNPSDVVDTIHEVLGSTGTVVMPTLPFTGTAVEYARQNPLFDSRRTPSRMGLLSELFRRMPGVVRSVHPTHPVAARGPLAQALIADHHRAGTPCGRGSPYSRFFDLGGRVLFLGASFDTLTLFHAAEEMLEPDMPFSPFTSEVFRLRNRTSDGTFVDTETRLFDPTASGRRNLSKLAAVLQRRGAWSEERLGKLDIIVVDATRVLETLRAMASEGQYCYD